MKPASLLRWYPRAWRARYGEELLALIQDTLEDGRPTWRLRLGVIRGGLRERGHQAWRVVRAVKSRTVPDQWRRYVTGLVLATLPETAMASPPHAGGWQAAAADGLLATVALTGVAVLADGLIAVPAVVRFLRAGGWPEVRRRVIRAAEATVVAVGVLAGLSVASGSRSLAQLDSSWVLSTGLLAAGLAMAVAIGLWAAATVAMARHLTLAPRVRGAQLLLGAVTPALSTIMFVSLVLWWSAVQSSVYLLVMGLVTLVLEGVLVPSAVGRAVRKGRRLRAASGGGPTINPSAQRTHGRHRA